MPAPFRTLHHVCIVVHDMEASVAYYESIGLGPWEPAVLSGFTALDMPSEEAFSLLQYRVLNLDNVQIQLCQPPELPCPQRDFLESHGEGVFHLGFEAPLDQGGEDARSVGLATLMSGRRQNGTGFTYFDTLSATGLVWMIRQSAP